MKRVHSFLVCEAFPIEAGLQLLDPSFRHAQGSREFLSWHQTWDFAREQVGKSSTTDSSQLKSLVIGDLECNLQVIATMGMENLESVFTERDHPNLWTSATLGSTGYFANLNRSHYAWGWIPGADREVPFRLNRLERHMERHPRGLLARVASLIAEARDLLIPT